MRKIAGYSITPHLREAQSVERAFLDITHAIDAWLERKGTIESGALITKMRFSDGRTAEYRTSRVESAVGSLLQHQLIEPTDAGRFQTSIAVGVQPARLAVYVELGIASNANLLSPIEYEARCPQVLRDILDLNLDWYVGSTPVSTAPIVFSTTEEGSRLADVIWHPNRNLPIVVVSEHAGNTLARGFDVALARDISGLALVARVGSDAAWSITDLRGREWSCFNGAIRVYWPMRQNGNDPKEHPLWTLDTLLNSAAHVEDAARRIRTQLRRRILAISAFSVHEPEFHAQIVESLRQQQFEELRARAKVNQDWQPIAEEYASENDRLRKALEEYRADNGLLRDQVTNLRLAAEWKDTDQANVQPEVDVPPETVTDAVGLARKRHAATLIFGDDVPAGIETLASDAGPPEKILKYLDALSDLVNERKKGPLGQSPIKWLNSRNVAASPESDTIRNSKAEATRRTWHDGVGRRTFDDHLKPAEGTSPDRCVRIYFDTDQQSSKIIVGWVGRHP